MNAETFLDSMPKPSKSIVGNPVYGYNFTKELLEQYGKLSFMAGRVGQMERNTTEDYYKFEYESFEDYKKATQ